MFDHIQSNYYQVYLIFLPFFICFFISFSLFLSFSPLLSYCLDSKELFGKATDVQTPPHKPAGCLHITLVDDDYSEGFRAIIYVCLSLLCITNLSSQKVNLAGLEVAKGRFYRCIGTISLDAHQKALNAVYMEEVSEDQIEFLRGAALSKWQPEE